MTTEDFIKKQKKFIGNKYDYSKVEYINNKNNIKLLHFSFVKNIINTNYILYTDILELINIIKK